MSTVAFWIGFSIIALGAIGGMFPLWKSAILSPDSLERRVYSTGCSIGLSMMLLSQLSDWRSALFMAVVVGLWLVFIAFMRSNHIKIGGRTYAPFGFLRRPDRPPALQPNDTVD